MAMRRLSTLFRKQSKECGTPGDERPNKTLFSVPDEDAENDFKQANVENNSFDEATPVAKKQHRSDMRISIEPDEPVPTRPQAKQSKLEVTVTPPAASQPNTQTEEQSHQSLTTRFNEFLVQHERMQRALMSLLESTDTGDTHNEQLTRARVRMQQMLHTSRMDRRELRNLMAPHVKLGAGPHTSATLTLQSGTAGSSLSTPSGSPGKFSTAMLPQRDVTSGAGTGTLRPPRRNHTRSHSLLLVHGHDYSSKTSQELLGVPTATRQAHRRGQRSRGSIVLFPKDLMSLSAGGSPLRSASADIEEEPDDFDRTSVSSISVTSSRTSTPQKNSIRTSISHRPRNPLKRSEAASDSAEDRKQLARDRWKKAVSVIMELSRVIKSQMGHVRAGHHAVKTRARRGSADGARSPRVEARSAPDMEDLENAVSAEQRKQTKKLADSDGVRGQSRRTKSGSSVVSDTSQEDESPHRLIDYIVSLNYEKPTAEVDSVEDGRAKNGSSSLQKNISLAHFPTTEHSDFGLPGNIPLFAMCPFPLFSRVKKKLSHDEAAGALNEPALVKTPPTFFNIVLTDLTGARVFGYCVHFYEEKEIAPTPLGIAAFNSNRVVPTSSGNSLLNKRNGVPGRPRVSTRIVTVWAKSMVIISRFPFHNAFHKCLNELYLLSGTRSLSLMGSTVSPQQLLTYLAFEVPSPISGGPAVRFRLGSSHIECALPSALEFPLLDMDLHKTLFSHLSTDNIIQLFVAVLTEQRIVLSSNNYCLLGQVSESLLALIFPFSWYHVYIPLVPKELLEVLDAPVPFIIGLLTPNLKDVRFTQDTVIVDIDNNSIRRVNSNDQCARAEKAPIRLPPQEEYDLVFTLRRLAEVRERSVKAHKLELLQTENRLQRIHTESLDAPADDQTQTPVKPTWTSRAMSTSKFMQQIRGDEKTDEKLPSSALSSPPPSAASSNMATPVRMSVALDSGDSNCNSINSSCSSTPQPERLTTEEYHSARKAAKKAYQRQIHALQRKYQFEIRQAFFNVLCSLLKDYRRHLFFLGHNMSIPIFNAESYLKQRMSAHTNSGTNEQVQMRQTAVFLKYLLSSQMFSWFLEDSDHAELFHDLISDGTAQRTGTAKAHGVRDEPLRSDVFSVPSPRVVDVSPVRSAVAAERNGSEKDVSDDTAKKLVFSPKAEISHESKAVSKKPPPPPGSPPAHAVRRITSTANAESSKQTRSPSKNAEAKDRPICDWHALMSHRTPEQDGGTDADWPPPRNFANAYELQLSWGHNVSTDATTPLRPRSADCSSFLSPAGVSEDATPNAKELRRITMPGSSKKRNIADETQVSEEEKFMQQVMATVYMGGEVSERDKSKCIEALQDLSARIGFVDMIGQQTKFQGKVCLSKNAFEVLFELVMAALSAMEHNLPREAEGVKKTLDAVGSYYTHPTQDHRIRTRAHTIAHSLPHSRRQIFLENRVRPHSIFKNKALWEAIYQLELKQTTNEVSNMSVGKGQASLQDTLQTLLVRRIGSLINCMLTFGRDTSSVMRFVERVSKELALQEAEIVTLRVLTTNISVALHMNEQV